MMEQLHFLLSSAYPKVSVLSCKVNTSKEAQYFSSKSTTVVSGPLVLLIR